MTQKLIDIIQKGESQGAEFKVSAKDVKEISKSVTALANTNGGHVCIGVSDNGDVKGVQNADKTQQVLSNAVQSIVPVPRVDIQAVSVSGKTVIAMYVQESADQEYYTYKGAIYSRVGTTNQRLEGASQLAFLQHKKLLNFDERITSNSKIEDLDEIAIENYLMKRKQDNYLNSHGVNEFLINTGLLYEKSGALKNAAILLFAKTPVQFFPQAEVKLVKFLDTEAVEIMDHLLVQSNLPETIDSAMGFIKKNLSKKIEIQGTVRNEIYDYPLPAIREIIVNAIVHRDYYSKDAIQINIFSDRMEITSPGGVPRHLTQEMFGSISVQRNPVVYRFLRDLGYVEGLGTGVPRVKNAMRKHGLKDPEFNWNEWFFRVCIYNGIAKKKVIHSPDDLNQRQQVAVDYLKKNGTLKSSTYTQINSVSQATSNKELKEMVDFEILDKVGSFRGAYYTLKNVSL